MKKLILVLSLIIGFSLMAGAQITKKTPEQRAAHHTKALQKKLNLTQDQAVKVQSAFLTMATRMDSLQNKPAKDKKSNQLAAKSIKLDTKKQVAAILTHDQKVTFSVLEKAKKERHKEKKTQTEVGQG